MTQEEREEAGKKAMELLNYFSERYDRLQPKPMVDCLVMGLAVLVRISFKEDHEQILCAVESIERDFRDCVNHIHEIHMSPHIPAGHA